MPGTILRDDWQAAVTDRLQQHARNAFQAVEQANQPPLQGVTIPVPPIDPTEIVQRLQQHGQDAWAAVQQANQPPFQGVQIDPNDVTARLQQHAQDAFQSIDQNVQSIGTGLQNVQQAVQQANQPPLQQQGVQDVDQGVVQPATPTVDRGGDLHAYARAAAQRAGIDPDIFERQIQQESGFDTTAKSPAGAQGIAQFMPATAAGMNLDPSDPYASLDGAAQLMAANLKKYGGDYGKALAAYNAGPGNVDKYGGIPPFEETQRYVSTILGGAKQAVQGAVEAGKQAVQNILPGVSQFGDKQLTNAEAYAACGPAAAVRFAQAMGRNPTLREATDLAKTVGWTEGSGMAGLQSESKLFDQMGVPHRVLGADWQAFRREAQSGNPVTLSTPGHYFTADAYDPASGAFHVGQSGLDLQGGSEWMTPSQMEQRMGALQGGLVADHPGTPSPSPISQGVGGLVQRAGDVIQQGGRAIGEGLQSLDNTIKTISSAGPSTGAGQALASFDQRRQDVADRISQVPGQIQEAVGPGSALATGKIGDYLPTGAIAKTPLGGALETMTAPDLMSHDELLRTPQADTARTILERMNRGAPVSDADVAEAARTLVASEAYAMTGEGLGRTPLPATGAEAPATRMFHGTGSTFDQVNPGRLSEDSLFGPGYYVTSDPRVAGGTVRGETAPLSATQQSLVDRGLLSPENALTQRGAVISRGYAQEMAPSPETVDMLTERANQLRQALQNPSLPESARPQLEGLLTKAEADVRQAAGPNVRAVDVPQDLKLFDLERPLTQDEATRVAGALEDWNPRRWDASDPEVQSEVQSWSTSDADGKSLYDLILGETGGNKGEVNQILSRAGFDGLSHTGGRIMPMVDEAGQTIEHDVNVIFPDSVNKVRNAISGTQGGQISTQFAARLGGAAAGGAVGYQTTPEDASPAERIARTAAGAGAGVLAAGTVASAARFRGSLDQSILENLRNSGIVAGPPRPAQAMRGFVPEAVDQTKQMLLTGPTTHIGNVIGGLLELGRLPASLAMGGRADDALAALLSSTKGLPQAATNALSLLGGLEPANLSSGASRVPRRFPIFRALSAADTFVRTLGEYQGMSAKANQLLRDAGMTPRDPGAAQFLASQSGDLFKAGQKIGAESVFGQAGSSASSRAGALEGAFRAFSTYKEGLLASPNKLHQALGALLDFEVPFSGVPVRMVSLVASRTPPGAQIRGLSNITRALQAGDRPGAQQAFGEMAMESTIQFLIAKNIADGNIRGPDDPDHPLGVHMPGMGWIDTKEWGAYALPMQIMAAFAEGAEKGGQNVPPSTPGATDVEKYANYYGPRFDAALKASMKPLVQAVPGMNMIRALATLAQGDLSGAGTKLAQDVVSRLTEPGIARFMENLTDPAARDVATKGVKSLWEGPMAAWPGLAELLPEKIDPTTGESMTKRRAGPGILIGQQNDVASPLTLAAAELRKAGYKDVAAPKTYAQDVTVGNATVKLSPDEQRAVTQITGARLKELSQRLDTPAYQNALNPQKANMLQAWVSQADAMREAAAIRVIGRAQFFERANATRQTAGRLNVQAPAPTDDLAFFNPTGSQHALTQRAAALAGTP